MSEETKPIDPVKAWRRFALQCAAFLTREQIAEAARRSGVAATFCEPDSPVQCPAPANERGEDGSCEVCRESNGVATSCLQLEAWYQAEVARLGEHAQTAASLKRRPIEATQYEYRITSGPRKAWDGSPDLTADGWEEHDQWERFDHHEERYWRRPLPGSADVACLTRPDGACVSEGACLHSVSLPLEGADDGK